MQLSAAGVSKLANHCPSLEILDISKCFNVDDHAIQDVLQVCTGTLRLLDTCTYVHTYIHTYVHTYIRMYVRIYIGGFAVLPVRHMLSFYLHTYVCLA